MNSLGCAAWDHTLHKQKVMKLITYQSKSRWLLNCTLAIDHQVYISTVQIRQLRHQNSLGLLQIQDLLPSSEQWASWEPHPSSVRLLWYHTDSSHSATHCSPTNSFPHMSTLGKCWSIWVAHMELSPVSMCNKLFGEKEDICKIQAEFNLCLHSLFFFNYFCRRYKMPRSRFKICLYQGHCTQMSSKLKFSMFLLVLERKLMDILPGLDGILRLLLTDTWEASMQYIRIKDWKGALPLKLCSFPTYL